LNKYLFQRSIFGSQIEKMFKPYIPTKENKFDWIDANTKLPPMDTLVDLKYAQDASYHYIRGTYMIVSLGKYFYYRLLKGEEKTNGRFEHEPKCISKSSFKNIANIPHVLKIDSETNFGVSEINGTTTVYFETVNNGVYECKFTKKDNWEAFLDFDLFRFAVSNFIYTETKYMNLLFDCAPPHINNYHLYEKPTNHVKDAVKNIESRIKGKVKQ
jgi:hypothetical protein